MISYLVKRCLNALLVIASVSVITFVVLNVIPGNRAVLMLGTDATPESLAALSEAMGLNVPLPRQYMSWILNALRGDLGSSYYFGEQVSTLIHQRLEVTMMMAVLAGMIGLAAAFVIGIFAALYQNSWIDYAARILIQIGGALPSFWVGMLAVIVFAQHFKLFPLYGYVPLSQGISASLHSIFLPSLVLALGIIGPLLRIVRSSMLSSLEQDYMIGAQVRGIPKAVAVSKYALRSALVAPFTIFSMQFARLLGGAVAIEQIFALPGLGRLLLIAIEQRDVMLLQGIILFITLIIVLISLISDILYTKMNATIQLESEAS